MELTLYNTLTRRKEVFEPLEPGKAGIYTCGPTVYAEAHVGNLRSYLFPDVLKKTLRRLGYTVTHVINITDVGHLTSDEDTGEDKMERAARSAGRSAWEIAAEHEEHFRTDLKRLRIDPADVFPKATDHIPEQIALIERLEAKGATYRTEDGIYFDTAEFPEYGRLARVRVEGLQEGARVKMGGKRHKTDFALWKFSPPDVQRQMEWPSPWGVGFPGWHLECSAMSMKYLGQTFDIHTGGTDHIPVHHTNEIAQSECATGQPFVRYWLHGEFLVLGEERRMGKSEGNLITLEELIGQGFDPIAYRYLALNSHYRSFLSFSTVALQGADTALMGLRRLVREALPAEDCGAEIERYQREAEATPSPGSPQEELLAALCDDLNAPQALGILWTAMRDERLAPEDKLAVAAFAEGMLSLGLFDFARLEQRAAIPPDIEELAERRWAARQAKDFAESDRLRDALAESGYTVRDRKDGYDLVPSTGGG
ncbi:MAG: cysteine--tRNA ligase [SAR324 cluster bacterium]|nr:cysteine--tRNA ligase [SAR324 cluster bacterium]